MLEEAVVTCCDVMYQGLLGKTEENSDSIVLITTWQGNMERAQGRGVARQWLT